MMASFAHDFRDKYDINLGVGYVNNQTIPQQKISRALDAVIKNPSRYKAAFNYGGPAGSQNLIDSLKRFIKKQRNENRSNDIFTNKQIIIGSSAVTSLLEGIAQIIKPGIVVTTDPMYYIYCEFLERTGFKIVTIPEDAKGIHIHLIEEKIRDYISQLSFFYIVTVGNPSSSILSNERLKSLIESVKNISEKAGRQIPLFIDTAYEHLIHDPSVEKPISGLLIDRNDLVYELGTLSKILSPGLRIGYMIGPNNQFMKAMIQRINDVGFSASLMNQEIASYLLDNHIEEQISEVNKNYQKKAKATKNCIIEQLGEEIDEIIGGSAGFYFYITFKDIITEESSDFFKYCSRLTGNTSIDTSGSVIKPRVIYLPGAFCVHPHGDLSEKGKRQLRISYGYEEIEMIKRGVSIMGEAIEYARLKGD
jgi:DNA-binding transcriptional MocR family regulator